MSAIARTSDPVEIKGPNRERGKLFSFAIKGDLTYRILTNTETDEQALILTMPRETAAGVGYAIVKEIEAEDAAKARTRVKE